MRPPELPLQPGPQSPVGALRVAGCIDDAGPDAWGQRVILRRRTGGPEADADTADLNLLTYLLESGSDRIGGLDFQTAPDRYTPRAAGGTLATMVEAADRLDAGEPLPPDLDAALLHGTSVGGARPKVLLSDGDRKVIAKLSSTRDPFPVVKAEGVAMDLARRAVWMWPPPRSPRLCTTMCSSSTGSTDRAAAAGTSWCPPSPSSDSTSTSPATPPTTTSPMRSGRASRRRMQPCVSCSPGSFNVCVSNADDHARNHAAFWGGTQLTLTPAYDLCPQLRTGNTAAQAMAYGPDGGRASQLAGLAGHAATYHLTDAQARAIIDHQLEVIHDSWDDAADSARLTSAERSQLWGRQILNPYALEGYTSPSR